MKRTRVFVHDKKMGACAARAARAPSVDLVQIITTRDAERLRYELLVDQDDAAHPRPVCIVPLGREKTSLLHLAVSLGSLPCAVVLLRFGLNPNTRGNLTGWTALHLAVYNAATGSGDTSIIRILLECGANPALRTSAFYGPREHRGQSAVELARLLASRSSESLPRHVHLLLLGRVPGPPLWHGPLPPWAEETPPCHTAPPIAHVVDDTK